VHTLLAQRGARIYLGGQVRWLAGILVKILTGKRPGQPAK
jgi:hypothetical protein